MVLVNFIRDPGVGIFARAKRVPTRSGTVTPPFVPKAKKVGEEAEESDKSE
jgi:hypothetical protein